MKKFLARTLLVATLLISFSFPVMAEEFSAKFGKYKGWGIITKTDRGMSNIYHWKTYDSERKYSFLPGELIAEQCFTDRIIGNNFHGRITYSSLTAGTVHLSVSKNWYRHSYLFDQIELRKGEFTVIGSLNHEYNGKGSIIGIRFIGFRKDGKATFNIGHVIDMKK